MRCSLLIHVVCVVWPIVDVAGLPARADEETLAQRRERLEQMSDLEKTRLLQKKSRFDALPPQDRERLRTIYEEISGDPRCDHLRGVLERYSEWLKTLTPVERAELAKLPPDERLAHIRQLVSAQNAKRFHMMSGGFLEAKDLGAIRQWLDEFVLAHAAEIQAAIPDDPNDRRLEKLRKLKKEFDPAEDLPMLRGFYLMSDPSRLPRPAAEDEERLRSMVSAEAREVLDKAGGDGARSQIIHRWMWAADGSGRIWPIRQADLDRFVKEELAESERVYLESLPRDRMYRELRWKYIEAKSKSGWGRPGMRMGPGGRRGPGGPGGPDGPSGFRKFDPKGPRNVGPDVGGDAPPGDGDGSTSPTGPPPEAGEDAPGHPRAPWPY